MASRLYFYKLYNKVKIIDRDRVHKAIKSNFRLLVNN